MKIRKGLNGGQYKPLSDEDVEKIHQTSLKVFSEVGVQVNFPEALELFEEGIQISRFCSSKLEEAERKVEVLTKTADGELKEEPLTGEQEGDVI